MSEMNVDSLCNAIAKLQEGLLAYQANPDYELIRDGLIQRFEFTYEISHKLLKRYLQRIVPNPSELNDINFSDLIRTANEYGLLKGNWKDWKIYRDMRSKTNHTYDRAIALEVVRGIPGFLNKAEFLLKKLGSVDIYGP